MSPILVRPVREQLEHDRVIRLLQAKSRRKYEAGINPGAQQNVPYGSGPTALYPDIVLASLDRGRKVQAIIEVETGESVNHLEALSQWAGFARLRTPFHLYVPSTMVEVALRLCHDNQIVVSEIWSYHGVGDEVRFALVHRARDTASTSRRAAATRKSATTPRKSAAAPRKKATRVVARPAKAAKSAPARGTAAKKRAQPQKRK